MSTNEINKVKYPGTPTAPAFDTVANWPNVDKVTQTTGEDINRNRDALLILERVLGANPHIGLFTRNPSTATVAERLGILENGISEGRFAWKYMTVQNAISAAPDVNGMMVLALGAVKSTANAATPVNVYGPLHVFDSGVSDPRALFDVGIVIKKTAASKKSTECLIQGTTAKNKPLLKIEDFANTTVFDPNHIALEIAGNVRITGYLDANYAIDHSKLNNINTTPSVDDKGKIVRTAVHVSRGNYHSHRRGAFDEKLARWTVDPNPTDDTYGIISHIDLEPQSTRTKNDQDNFVPDPNVAYHVTNGDDHDHVGGRGAQLLHANLVGISPEDSNHVSGGDRHAHDPLVGDGGLIPTRGVALENGITFTRIDSATGASLAAMLASIDTLLTTDGASITDHESRINSLEQSQADQDLDINSIRTDVRSAVSSADDARAQVADLTSQVTAATTLATTANTNANTANTNASTALSLVQWITTSVTETQAVSRTGARMYLAIDTTDGAIAVTLPTAIAGDMIMVKDEAGSCAANNATFVGNGSQTIDGSNKVISTNRGSFTIFYSNGQWRVVAAA